MNVKSWIVLKCNQRY